MLETLEMLLQSLGQEDPLKEGMTTSPCILACRIPWTEEPGGLKSMGSQGVWHNWSDLIAAAAAISRVRRNSLILSQKKDLQAHAKKTVTENSPSYHSPHLFSLELCSVVLWGPAMLNKPLECTLIHPFFLNSHLHHLGSGFHSSHFNSWNPFLAHVSASGSLTFSYSVSS